MIEQIFFIFKVFWVKEVNGIEARYVTLTHDLVRQGHVILKVTYLISGPMHAKDMNFFCFHGLLGQGSQWHVNQIRVLDT